eukprot:TRINITY_DN8725_c0_g2_i1.p1 TRINITY_DN8725_c0_g2~~TRINITY_DN8725_c0_g2_i1.p1  ORF type:complete len:746 (+),score=220.03 TRINITY_DN8725_c0_g2_i1:89-2326(+)
MNIDECWASLKVGADLVFEPGKKDELSTGKYMEYYTLVYDYCTKSKAHQTMNGGANIAGIDLYERIRGYLQERCAIIGQDVKDLHGDELLNRLRVHWQQYLFSRKVLSNICNYLNRHCVQRQQEDQQTDVYPLDVLALFEWREQLFKSIHTKVTQALLDLIHRERNGEVIVSSLVADNIGCLVALGLTKAEHGTGIVREQRNEADLGVYVEYFEKPFLAATKKYYEEESAKYLAENSLPDYMKQVHTRVQQEDERVQRSLHASSSKPLGMTCTDALIKDHTHLFVQELGNLLVNERNEDMHRMFVLLCRVESGVSPMRERLEVYIRQQGESAIEGCGDISMSNEDAKKYVQVILDVHGKYRKLVEESFQNDPRFQETLDKACRAFINKNKVTKASKTSRSPELLAKFCDSLLKKSSKNPPEDQLEQILNQVLIIFNYLDDKDVFEKFYKKLLASRLVYSKSASDDAEASMLSKLKQASGAEYTQKLQRMFQDKETNKQLRTKFKEHLTSSGWDGPDFNVRVLTANIWPYSDSLKLNVPRELERCVERFTSFYSKQHEGRVLSWLYALCKGEVVMHYTKKERILECNTIQIALLLAFNTTDFQTALNLSEMTGVKLESMQAQLDLLVKGKLILKKDDGYVLNFKYNHKKIRLKIDQAIKSEQKAESESTHKAAEEDRKYIIQACLVRIMKTRKTLKHKELVAEALDELRKRFAPKVSMIKRNIENLIEQEYIKRRENTHDQYDYVA